MKKTNFFHMNNINTLFKKIYPLLILTFLFFLVLVNTAHSAQKIGSIVNLKNEVYAVNTDGEKRLLDLYDEIFLEDEILTNELSTVTVQYNDSSTVIIKQSSSFKVTDFNITGLKDVFFGKVDKGTVIIESGKIAKKNNGSMVIELPTMTLEVKGTRFNIENNSDGTSEVSLAEDSFGNVGTINIASEGDVKTLFDTEQVISVSTETGISERPKTDDEKQELVDVSNDLIEASSIDENVIQKNLEEKLLNGSLLDANGDGVIDESDIEVIKEGIKIEKQEKLDFIVDNSTGENTEFLSKVLNKSDEVSIGQSMDKIFEINNDLVASVITNLANEDNTFLTTSNSEANNAIKEKIYTQMLSDVDGNNNNVALIGDIISRSDGDTIERMVNFVEISDANNEGTNLSLQILSSVADARSLNDNEFGNEEQSTVDRLMEEAVFNATNSEDGAMYLANIMNKGSEESVYMMMDTIGQVGETFTESTLALEVFSSMAENESFDDMSFGDQGQDLFDNMMEDAVFSAANSEDGATMLGTMMANGSEESMGMMMSTISMVADTDPNSTLALEVLSSMAENDYLDDMSFGDQGQDLFDNMMEDAVYAAANSEDGATMLASVMTNSDVDTVGTMMDYISDVSDNDPNSSFAAEVLSEVITAVATSDTYFDTETTDMYNNLVDTIAYAPDTETFDGELMYDGGGFSMTPPYYHRDTGGIYDNAGFDRDGNSSAAGDGDDTTYDASGFSMIPPYYHRDTGGIYNNAGFDRDGNSSATGDGDDTTYDASGFSTIPPYYHKDTGTMYDNDGYDSFGNYSGGGDGYDASGFSMTPPYYHRDTGGIYNNAGFDKDGNYSGGGGGTPYWMTEPFFNASYTTSDTISLFASAESSPLANGIIYSATGLPAGVSIDSSSGEISGSPDAGSYSVTVTATDAVDGIYEITTASSTFTVTAGGGGSVAWTTTSASFPSDLTIDTTINSITLNATGVGIISYSYSGSFPSGIDLIGDAVSGTPNTEQAATSVTITATDEDNNTSDLFVSFPAVDAGGGGGGTPSWLSEPSFDASYTTSDTISLFASAQSSPLANGIIYSATDLPAGVSIDSSSGEISGSPDAGSYSVTVTATDAVDGIYEITTASSTFTVTEAGGSYDENGFSTTTPFYHRETGTLYDENGYNSAGYNSDGYDAAMNYDAAYDENASPA
ncbi:putative Ig domain-containing protein [Pelagibacteraceae bacterium]|nr:putative Ig domain-containing protein [Pelagibacteraceae bacterium]